MTFTQDITIVFFRWETITNKSDLIKKIYVCCETLQYLSSTSLVTSISDIQASASIIILIAATTIVVSCTVASWLFIFSGVCPTFTPTATRLSKCLIWVKKWHWLLKTYLICKYVNEMIHKTKSLLQKFDKQHYFTTTTFKHRSLYKKESSKLARKEIMK